MIDNGVKIVSHKQSPEMLIPEHARLSRHVTPHRISLFPSRRYHIMDGSSIYMSSKRAKSQKTLSPRKQMQKPNLPNLLDLVLEGVYMPPARLRALQAAASSDKASPEYQRLSWDALRKSITGIVNRVNITNIKQVVPELFSENLIRGRGLFARSIMKAQAASLPFTPVFAALVAILNSKVTSGRRTAAYAINQPIPTVVQAE
jgi:hypothetical protein